MIKTALLFLLFPVFKLFALTLCLDDEHNNNKDLVFTAPAVRQGRRRYDWLDGKSTSDVTRAFLKI